MAFRGNSYKPKVKKKKTNLYYPYTDEDIKRVNWCMNKNIHIAVSPGETKWKIEIRMNKGIKVAVIPKGMEWQVEISINNKIHLNPEVYKAKEAYEKMYEYYKYYYDKHNI